MSKVKSHEMKPLSLVNHQSRKTGKGLHQPYRICHVSSYSAKRTGCRVEKKCGCRVLPVKWLVSETILVWITCSHWVKFGQKVYGMQRNTASFPAPTASFQPVRLAISEEFSSSFHFSSSFFFFFVLHVSSCFLHFTPTEVLFPLYIKKMDLPWVIPFIWPYIFVDKPENVSWPAWFINQWWVVRRGWIYSAWGPRGFPLPYSPGQLWVHNIAMAPQTGTRESRHGHVPTHIHIHAHTNMYRGCFSSILPHIYTLIHTCICPSRLLFCFQRTSTFSYYKGQSGVDYRKNKLTVEQTGKWVVPVCVSVCISQRKIRQIMLIYF